MSGPSRVLAVGGFARVAGVFVNAGAPVGIVLVTFMVALIVSVVQASFLRSPDIGSPGGVNSGSTVRTGPSEPWRD